MTSPFPPPVLPPRQLAPAPGRSGEHSGRVADQGSDDATCARREGSVGIPTASTWESPRPRSPATPARETADHRRRPARADDDRDEITPPIVERPDRVVTFRILVAAMGFMSVVLAWQVAAGADGDASETSLRRAGLLIATAYSAGHAVFALWSYRYRRIIDDLRWTRYGRETWRGAWAAAWSLTVVGVASVFAGLAVLDAHVAWYVVAGALTVALRVAMLKTLGSNMARVVLGARRRLGIWGTVIGATDLLVVGVLVTAFVSIEPRRTMLAWLAGWAVFALVDVGVGLLSYMKRVERWTLAWWIHRHEPHQPVDRPAVADADGDTSARESDTAGAPESSVDGSPRPQLRPVAARVLVPSVVLRYVVILSYWLVAAAALRAGLTVGLQRDELTLASDPSAAIDRLEQSIQPFIAAIVLMQVAQGLWSVVQARTAQRATSEAPSALGMGALFVAGPAVLVYGLIVHPDHTMVFAALALLLNLACWVASFGAFSQTIQDLGRSARAMATWSVVVSLHWILGFLFGPLTSLDDDLWFAVAIVGLSIVDAAIVLAASFHAWHAMRGMELAVRDRVGIEAD